ncbi:hypothetical protein B5M44_10665 [Shinella sumterensis]|uniref:hypothetical protein n=1 Tax=Shinella sumterensis TaxID=1967501 RepID=UPI00106E81CF|nr:hypothetical protein [Shinella sumterensis]MCD1264563.1 hypothetical protein [Shinella sumterensis]TFE98482.1 hypothetical protein B5M44_10665 [Shinella sumterensis]
MTLLHRILRIRATPKADQHLERLSAATDQELLQRRQDLRQKVQKLESGGRVMETMAGAMGMMRGLDRG